MSKYSNSFTIKYLLRLPIVPLWSKEKVAKFTHLKYIENLDKTKFLNKLEGSNPLIEQYFIYDHLYSLSKPIFFFGAIFSMKMLFNKRISVAKKIIYPSMIIVPTGILTSVLFSLKQMLHMTYIKRDLLKTEDQREVDDYLRFSKYYSNI